MTKMAVIFPRPSGGNFCHFAHFVSDFVLPFLSILRKNELVESLLGGQGIELEIQDRRNTTFGPLLPLVHEIFPGLIVKHVSRFSSEPVCFHRKAWHNNVDDIDHFIGHLKRMLPIKPSSHGVIIVQRGIDRQKYPGHPDGLRFFRSGADRRTIGSGIERLVARVMEKRPDAVCVTLEEMSFAEQVSLFLNADTLIGQHGAAFVHSHWMPKNGHLIQLQCHVQCHKLQRHELNMQPTLAKLRNHRSSVIYYPCAGSESQGCLIMNIGNATKVSRLLSSRPCLVRS